MLDLTHPRTAQAFRTIRRLLLAYLAVSVAALVAIVLMRDDAAEVNSAVWTRASIVVVTAALMLLFATRAAEGSRGAYRRLRIISIVTVVVIAAIIASPGTFPAVAEGRAGRVRADHGRSRRAGEPAARCGRCSRRPPAGE